MDITQRAATEAEDRAIADALWGMLVDLDLRDSIGAMEYRRALLGQTEAERLRKALTEGPESRVAEWAAEGRRFADRIREIEGMRGGDA
jgi:hypothetical protein